MREGSRVLVTGGGGFLGAFLCLQLVKEGADVTVLDNFSSGNLERLRSVTSCRNFHLVRGDILSSQDVHTCVEGRDTVFHFAAEVGVVRTASCGIAVLDSTLKGISNLLSESVSQEVDTFVFSSSSEVYGEPARLPSKETDLLAPKSTYAVAKVAAERYCEEYSAAYGINAPVFRYFNVYGPLQDERFVIPQFVRSALHGEELTVYGDGTQTRDFCFIDDAVSMTLAATLRTRGFGVYNIGSGERTSLKKLAQLVADISGRKSRITFTSLDCRRPQSFEITHRQADIAKVVTLCGFSPKHSLKEGLRRCYEALLQSSREC